MEPESPSSYPQVTANFPYPEPTPSSPHDPLQLPEDHHVIRNSIYLSFTASAAKKNAADKTMFITT